jgi:RimJ/RimL family protein N-acetyltransferase
MQKIQIRTATKADLPTLLEFEQGIITVERPFDETLKEGSITYYDIEGFISSENVEVIVAVAGTEIVSSAYGKIKTASPYLNHEQYAYLGFMFTKPEYRGRGINKMIIERLNDWAKSKNLKEVRLDVYSDNESAIRAYKKAGFKKHMVTMRIEI